MNRLGYVNGNSSQMKQRLGPNPSSAPHLLTEGDARMKLIAKKRRAITDARDRLAQIAKQEDARVKLNKLKTMKSSNSQSSSRSEQQSLPFKAKIHLQNSKLSQVGKTINTTGPLKVVKTITRASGTTRVKGGAIVRTVNGSSKPLPKPVPLLSIKNASLPSSERYHPLPSNPNVVTIRNDKAVAPQRTKPLMRSSLPQLKAKRTLHPSVAASSISRRSMNSSVPPLTRTFKGNVWEPYMAPAPILPREEIKPARLKITTTNNYMDYDAPYAEGHWNNYAQLRAPAMRRPYEPAQEDYMPSPSKRLALLSSNIASRLDQPRRPMQTAGYKVVITNLHPVVTVDDVEELFRNIGDIRHARIVREGIAEVIFMNEEDAYRSVDVYHNRQLDGQAMNVTVVTRKSSVPFSPYSMYESASNHSSVQPRYSPTPQYPSRRPNTAMRGGPQAPVMRNSHISTKSVLRTAAGGDRSYNSSLSTFGINRSQKVDVSPDIGVIHHALFSGRQAANTGGSNLKVYVKMNNPGMRGRE